MLNVDFSFGSLIILLFLLINLSGHPRIIHRDIKSSNILLYLNYEAKVSYSYNLYLWCRIHFEIFDEVCLVNWFMLKGQLVLIGIFNYFFDCDFIFFGMIWSSGFGLWACKIGIRFKYTCNYTCNGNLWVGSLSIM